MRLSPLLVAAVVGAVAYSQLPDGTDRSVTDQVAAVVQVMAVGAQPRVVIAQATSVETPAATPAVADETAAIRTGPSTPSPRLTVAEAPVIPGQSPMTPGSGPAPRPPRAIVTEGGATSHPEPMPRRPVSDAQRRTLAKAIQQQLARVGCYEDAIDGTWSPATRRAMQAFTGHVNARLPTSEPDDILLTLVQGYRDKACGTCASGDTKAADGRCVPRSVIAKSHRTGETATAAVVTPPTAIAPIVPPAPTRAEPRREAPQAWTGRMAAGAPNASPREAPAKIESWIPPPSETIRRRELAAIAETAARAEREQEAEQRKAQAAEARRARHAAEQSARSDRLAALARDNRNVTPSDKQATAATPPPTTRPNLSALDGPRVTATSPVPEARAPVIRDITVAATTTSSLADQSPRLLGGAVPPPMSSARATPRPSSGQTARSIGETRPFAPPRTIVRLQPTPSTFRSRIFSDLALRAP